jgi:hypothetical protein
MAQWQGGGGQLKFNFLFYLIAYFDNLHITTSHKKSRIKIKITTGNMSPGRREYMSTLEITAPYSVHLSKNGTLSPSPQKTIFSPITGFINRSSFFCLSCPKMNWLIFTALHGREEGKFKLIDP